MDPISNRSNRPSPPPRGPSPCIAHAHKFSEGAAALRRPRLPPLGPARAPAPAGPPFALESARAASGTAGLPALRHPPWSRTGPAATSIHKLPSAPVLRRADLRRADLWPLWTAPCPLLQPDRPPLSCVLHRCQSSRSSQRPGGAVGPVAPPPPCLAPLSTLPRHPRPHPRPPTRGPPAISQQPQRRRIRPNQSQAPVPGPAHRAETRAPGAPHSPSHISRGAIP
jgi:hypothetical protein